MDLTKFKFLIQDVRKDNPKLYDALNTLLDAIGPVLSYLTTNEEGDLIFNALVGAGYREVFRITALGQIRAQEVYTSTPQNRFPYVFADAMRIGPPYLGNIYLGRAIAAGWSRGLELREFDATHMCINSRTAVPGAMDLVLQSGGGKVGIGTGATALTYDLELNADSAGKPATAVWNVISDERTKKDRKEFTKGLELVKQLNPTESKYNGKFGTIVDLPVYGVTAQELLKIAPEMVQVPEDDTKPLSVNYHNLPFMLINAVKELSDKVDALSKKLDEREKK